MNSYGRHLAGERLQKAYDLAPPRVRQYLDAEIDFLAGWLELHHEVLELGCGYGRVMLRLAPKVHRIMGVDIAPDSLERGRKLAGLNPHVDFMEMDALALSFQDGAFDAVACVQNGICAFGADPEKLVLEALRVTRRGGFVFLSSYAPDFWPHRLEWFELQARLGLIGPIDRERTGNGVIVCEDGFRAGTMTAEDFRGLCTRLRLLHEISVVDGSSVFCVIIKQ